MPFYNSGPSQIPDILYRGQEEFTKMDEEAKKINQSAKAADAFLTANPELLSQLNLTPEQYKAGGARDRVAAMTGLLQSQGYAKAKQDIANQSAQEALVREHIKQMQQEEGEGIDNALKAFTNYQEPDLSGYRPAAPAQPADLTALLAPYRPNLSLTPGSLSGQATPPATAPMAALLTPDAAGMANPMTGGQAPDLTSLLKQYAPSQAASPALSSVLPASAVPPANLTQLIQQNAPRGTVSPNIRAALNTPGLGGRGAIKLLDELTKLQALQENAAGPNWKFSKIPDTESIAASLGKSGFVVPSSNGQAITRVLPDGSMERFNGRIWERIAPPNPAQQQQADNATIQETEKALQGIETLIGRWQYQADEHKRDPDKNPAPDQSVLEKLRRRQALQETLMERAASGILGTAKPSAQGNPTSAQPAVGTIKSGYRYNGKFAPSDRRAWEKVQ